MANEIKLQYQPSEVSVYACVFNYSGQVRDTANSAWVTFDDANIDNYDIALTESGDESGLFKGDMPSDLTEGVFTILAYQGDKLEANTQDVVGSAEIAWNGYDEIQIDEIRDIRGNTSLNR